MLVVLLLPLISALIGWFTNWVAVKMLFHPRHPRKILGITFHGIFPKRQYEVADKIGKLIAAEFLNASDVIPHLTSKEQMQQIKALVEQRLDEYLNGTFKQKHPVLAAFLTEKRREEFKQEILEEIEFFAPEIIDHVVMKMERDFDVAGVIRGRVADLQVDRLEEILMVVLEKEFKFVEYIGGVIGFFIGLVQVGITFLRL
ncbi:MAG: DUF445 family protein [Chitinophagales bacterium]|nr:DUF445 family protein [Chitinophagales bacterium]